MRKISVIGIGGERESGHGYGDPDMDIISPEHRYSLSPGESVIEDGGATDLGAFETIDDSETEESIFALDDAMVEIIDSDSKNELKAIFSCDIAKTVQQKIAGLQAYQSLENSAGLLFPYKKPEDVIYHMGTVSYPIDILFLDSNNLIKKIYRNIQPGTLATFGCSNVKNVLEICGGLADRLEISEGDFALIRKNNNNLLSKMNKLSSRVGVSKKSIIKFSNLSKNSISNWNDYPILNINNKITKLANNNFSLSDLVLSFSKNKYKKIRAFYFDDLIKKSPMLRVYKTSSTKDEESFHIAIDGSTVSLEKDDFGNEIYRDITLEELLSRGSEDNEILLKSFNKSFKNFIKSAELYDEISKIFREVKRASRDLDAKVVILTSSSRPKYLREVISNRIDLEYGERNILSSADVLKVSKYDDIIDLTDILKKKYGSNDIKLFCDDDILKRAGMPVPDSIKERAKKVIKILNSSLGYLEKSLDDVQKNLNEYNKLNESSPDKISSTKGQYFQSSKRISESAKKFLVQIRDAVKILNEIKDMSSTFEIIDSLANSAKNTSDGLEEVFDLIEKIESPDFILLLGEKVGGYEKHVDGLRLAIERAKDYINSNILGLVILSR